jgi:hypothetical protein
MLCVKARLRNNLFYKKKNLLYGNAEYLIYKFPGFSFCVTVQREEYIQALPNGGTTYIFFTL